MATRTWRPGAAAIAKEDTATVGGTIEASDLFIVKIGSKLVSTVAGSTTAANVATAIAAALTGLDPDVYPEFGAIIWAAAGATVTATANDAGILNSITVSTTESDGSASDGQTFTIANTVANSGANVWDLTANWSGATVPTTGDTVILENSDIPVQYDLAQSGVTLAALNIRASFEADIGLPETNPGDWPEYLPTYLAIGATLLTIGEGDGGGSGRIKIDNGSIQTTAVVRATGSGEDNGIPALLWKGTHASNAMTALNGEVGIAFLGGETATVASLTVVGAEVVVGSGTTLTTCILSGNGSIELRCAATTITLEGEADTITATGTGNITNLNVFAGTFDCQRSSTITNCTIGPGGTVDLTNATGTVTFTNAIYMAKGASFIDPRGLASFDYIQPQGCSIGDLNVDIGAGLPFER
jgi:hypothetical protein